MIPLATTTITVRRPTVTGGDPYDGAVTTAVAAASVRAHISAPAGVETLRGGQQESLEWRLACDPVALDNADQVIDDQTGLVYEVVWAAARTGLGLDHVEAGLRRTEAAV